MIANCFCDLSFEYRCSFSIGMAHYLPNRVWELVVEQMETKCWHLVFKPYTIRDHPMDLPLALELLPEFEVAHQHLFCLE